MYLHSLLTQYFHSGDWSFSLSSLINSTALAEQVISKASDDATLIQNSNSGTSLNRHKGNKAASSGRKVIGHWGAYHINDVSSKLDIQERGEKAVTQKSIISTY